MSIYIKGLAQISGPLIALENIENAHYDELVEVVGNDNALRYGRVIEMLDDKVLVQMFDKTEGLNLRETKTHFTGKPIELGVSEALLGRTFNGLGQPIDGLGEVWVEKTVDINGRVINPVARIYPKDFINTGISSIDGLNTLIRGQKLPIFSGSGLPHNQLAAQIIKQAKILKDKDSSFAIVFAAMGIKNDVADFFKKAFEEAGVMNHVSMFLNLAKDPIIERILTPRFALSAAEYLAFEKNHHILVVMSDMTAYCEALREFSNSKEEIPGRKGYPGYLYSDLSSLYERAGCVEGSSGSLTQIPILTMPNDDISHPIPDSTGYITEGQIVLDRNLHQQGVFPPIAVLPSLSRLMKDGIGKGLTRSDHQDVASQLFASYAKVMDVRNLAAVIGADELSAQDKFYLDFGRYFEFIFVNQANEDRNIEETLDLSWRLISLLPEYALDRLDTSLKVQYYDPEGAKSYFKSHYPEIYKGA